MKNISIQLLITIICVCLTLILKGCVNEDPVNTPIDNDTPPNATNNCPKEAKKTDLEEYIVYFTDTTACASIPTDSTSLVLLAAQLDTPTSNASVMIDTFCQDRIRYLASLVRDGAIVIRPDCECQNFLIRFKNDRSIDPQESITSAKGRLRHTGGGAIRNVIIDLGPEENIDDSRVNNGSSLPPDGSLVVGLVDLGLNFSETCLEPYFLTSPANATEYETYNSFSCDKQDVLDPLGHGTHLAGIIALPLESSQINDPSISNQSLEDLRILSVKITEGKKRQADLYSAICGIQYAIDRGAKILNLSWGFYKTVKGDSLQIKLGALTKIIRYAKEKNVLVIAAAGNDSTNIDQCHFWPASLSSYNDFDNVVSVAALDSSRSALAAYSNFGDSTVEFIAPGTKIQSTNTAISNGFDRLSGTSIAVPFVTKLAAYYYLNILESGPSEDPREPTYKQIKLRIRRNANTTSYRTHLGTDVSFKTIPLTPPLDLSCN
ncbi:MAG: S8 family serine peptidase [Bacteroidota bacterium]